ncbi:helix-turn-helix domain-containing protein [Croceicoccus sp. BE223]|uniref:winged helix-turn-helix transcriptional regulator n=1 Tax=Croceicoccus sp. BE223 TaxID=2817716 RepID=UPI00285CEF5B|nr:helix-turn-helix domain-containing protein [Croceicoccus sp. BE223]MDR7103511.1 DNA-binding HxlR family transcriptional regulator [Croceicoccus sp. BE223]
MEIDLAPAQEGTERSQGDTHVTAAIEAVGACQAVTDMLSRVGDKWSMQVVMKLGEQSRRFNELRRIVDGISQRMLTRTLRNLERDGLVSRTVTPTVPPRVDYALTPLGRSLWGPVAGLSQWVLDNRGRIESSRAAYDLREED